MNPFKREMDSVKVTATITYIVDNCPSFETAVDVVKWVIHPSSEIDEVRVVSIENIHAVDVTEYGETAGDEYEVESIEPDYSGVHYY